MMEIVVSSLRQHAVSCAQEGTTYDEGSEHKGQLRQQS